MSCSALGVTLLLETCIMTYTLGICTGISYPWIALECEEVLEGRNDGC